MARSALIIDLDAHDPIVEVKTQFRGGMQIRIFPRDGSDSYVLITGDRAKCREFLSEFEFQVGRGIHNAEFHERKGQ